MTSSKHRVVFDTTRGAESKHRVVIDAYKQGDIAFKWCADNIPLSEWSTVTSAVGEWFYFKDEKYVQNFLLVNGGRYYKNGK
jgi:hypothetical protein